MEHDVILDKKISMPSKAYYNHLTRKAKACGIHKGRYFMTPKILVILHQFLDGTNQVSWK